MRFLSKDLNLSMVYTNHSIRATVITTLDTDGFEARHIMKLSSHKKEFTIKEYAVHCPDPKRKEMFDSLSSALMPSTKKPKTSTCTTSTNNDDQIPNDMKDVLVNLPNFDIEPLNDFDTIDDSVLANLIYEDTDQINSKTDKQTTGNEKLNVFARSSPKCRTYMRHIHGTKQSKYSQPSYI